jgi:hypothetical protein
VCNIVPLHTKGIIMKVAGIAAAVLMVGMMASGAAMADGNSLLTQCQQFIKAADRETDFDRGQAGMCVGFVEGVVSTTAFFSENLESEAKLCVPKNATNGQLARVVVKYLKDHPAKLNEGKTGLVWLAMRDAYPCKG